MANNEYNPRLRTHVPGSTVPLQQQFVSPQQIFAYPPPTPITQPPIQVCPNQAMPSAVPLFDLQNQSALPVAFRNQLPQQQFHGYPIAYAQQPTAYTLSDQQFYIVPSYYSPHLQVFPSPIQQQPFVVASNQTLQKISIEKLIYEKTSVKISTNWKQENLDELVPIKNGHLKITDRQITIRGIVNNKIKFKWKSPLSQISYIVKKKTFSSNYLCIEDEENENKWIIYDDGAVDAWEEKFKDSEEGKTTSGSSNFVKETASQIIQSAGETVMEKAVDTVWDHLFE